MYDREKLINMSLEALSDFDAFCRKNNLTYAIAYGTELGCVRHGGFIPWDDDVDVDMPIEDCIKLAKIWNKKLNGKYFLQSKHNELFKPGLFYQIRKDGTTWIDPNCEDIPMHWGIAIIDIFPVYHAPRNAFLRKAQNKLFYLAMDECRWSSNHKKAAKIKHYFHRFITLFYINIVIAISNLSKKSNYGFCDVLKVKMSDLYPAKPVKFENIELMGHNNPDAYLSSYYGDYMTPPPEKEREGHAEGIVDLDNDYKIYIKK